LLCGSSGWADEFTQSIRPVLMENCAGCHSPANPRNRIDFLKAEAASDLETRRTLWRDVAVQLRNRTMPPLAASKLLENDRLRVASWIDQRLRDTACSLGDYAGYVPPRRLNRREYRNTVRDLFGVDLAVAELFPADEAGGTGFDTNADTLYVPPMLLERYMEAAQKILDRVIFTPPFVKVVASHRMEPPVEPGPKPGRTVAPGGQLSASVTVFVEGDYNLRVSIERPAQKPLQLQVLVDDNPAGTLAYARDSNGGATARIQTATLTRGVHRVTVVNSEQPILFYSLTVEQKIPEPHPEKRALHYRLFGVEAGQAPLDRRKTVRQLLSGFLPKAYRHPVEAGEVERFLAIYDRAAERGDPYEEAVKLALKAVLVSPRFLFHIETAPGDSGIRPLGHYDIAARLSYFLWATMPDDELTGLAAAQRLQDPQVIGAQVERMLDDPRSRAFSTSFMGQWLGTQEIGGRVVPLLTELQHFYTPEASADLREQPVLLFHHILLGNRSLLELLTANYTFMTERLLKYYDLEGKIAGVEGDGFHLVQWPDDRRAGILGLASVLAMTSHYRQSSPVLRGAWVLDTLLGTPVPPPPPDVPPLEKAAKSEAGLTMRQILAKHRNEPSCAACHNLMDPIGFGLENFDWMGRWRDKETNGAAVDASGTLPSGEKFNGPVELRQVLLSRKEEFLRHLVGKTLGYALGRALQDGDHCTIQRLVDSLEKDGYRARTLVREIALSLPFRNTQGGIVVSNASPSHKRSRRPLLGER
jgi:mono/diheme cytochrome c family protein